jgi:hypothetical protein
MARWADSPVRTRDQSAGESSEPGPAAVVSVDRTFGAVVFVDRTFGPEVPDDFVTEVCASAADVSASASNTGFG